MKGQRLNRAALYIPFFACLGALLMGYEIGIIGSALIFIKPEFQLSTAMEGMIASIIIPGTVLGVLLITFIADKWDRRYYLSLSAVIFIISLSVLALANNALVLIVGRLLSGIAIGITLVIVPLYLAEIASVKARGAYLIIYQLSITFGVLLGYGISYVLAHYHAWREMFASGLLICFLQLLSPLLLPASPYHCHKEKKASGKFFSRKYYSSLIIGNVLSLLHQMTGINAIAFFTPQIFLALSHHKDTSAIFAGLILMIGNFIFTIPSFFIFKRWGRRPILLFSFLIQFVTLLLLGLMNLHLHQYVIIILLLMYFFGFAVGLGPGMWLIASEIYPLPIRSKAMGLTVIMNNIAAFLVIGSFLSLMKAMGSSNLFLLYSAISFAGLCFVWLCLPETKDKQLEE